MFLSLTQHPATYPHEGEGRQEDAEAVSALDRLPPAPQVGGQAERVPSEGQAMAPCSSLTTCCCASTLPLPRCWPRPHLLTMPQAEGLGLGCVWASPKTWDVPPQIWMNDKPAEEQGNV